MIFAIVMLAIIFILWTLLVKGLLWKIILCISGWLLLYAVLNHYSMTANSGINVFNTLISWAKIIPTIIVFLAVSNTKE